MNKPMIEARNIEKIYNEGKPNELQILKNIDLKIKKGELIIVFGPSGSGKSTLLHILGCLDRPTVGEVLIEGKKTSEMSDDDLARIRGKRIGFVFQQFYLIPTLTASENVQIPMRLNGYDKEEASKRAKKLLESVGLGERLTHRPKQLSGGELQRVAIARSLANDPKIIMADEPTGNLDSKTGKEIFKLLKDLNEKGYTLVIVTHDLSLAHFAKRKINIKDGEIVGDEKNG